MTYFHELMQHFDMAFSWCYIVPIIFLFNIIRARENMLMHYIWMEYGLDFILGLVLFRFAVFMGVVDDISSAYNNWTIKLFVVGFVSFSLFIIHFIMLIKHSK